MDNTNSKAPTTPTSFLVTPAARIAFPALFEKRPRIKGSDKLTYQCVLLFPPTTDLKPFLAAARVAMQERWQKVLPFEKLSDFPLRKCNSLERRPAGYEDGWTFLSCHNGRRPGVYDRQNNPVDDPEAVYGGMWVRANINAWAWEFQSKRGVSFGLNGVQILRDDEPFSGAATNVQASFGAVGDDADFGLPPAAGNEFDFELPS